MKQLLFMNRAPEHQRIPKGFGRQPLYVVFHLPCLASAKREDGLPPPPTRGGGSGADVIVQPLDLLSPKPSQIHPCFCVPNSNRCRSGDGRNAIENAPRGGSWRDRPFHATASYRLPYRQYQRVYNVGFRVVCEGEWKDSRAVVGAARVDGERKTSTR